MNKNSRYAKLSMLAVTLLLNLLLIVSPGLSSNSMRTTNFLHPEEEDNFFPQEYEQEIVVQSKDNAKTAEFRIGNKRIVVQKDLSKENASILILGYSVRNNQVISLKPKDREALQHLKISQAIATSDELVADSLDLLAHWPAEAPLFIYVNGEDVLLMKDSCIVLYQPRGDFALDNVGILRLLTEEKASIHNRISPTADDTYTVETKVSEKRVTLRVNDKRIILERPIGSNEVKMIGYSAETGEVALLSDRDFATLIDLTLSLDLEETDELMRSALGILNAWPNNMPILVLVNPSKVISVPGGCRPEYWDRSLDNPQKDLQVQSTPSNEDFTINAFSSVCGSTRNTAQGRILTSIIPTRYESFSHLVGNAKGDYSTGNCFGRCGIGCNTFGAIYDRYTQDCFNHDGCVNRFGYVDRRCNVMFADCVDDSVSAPICSPIIDSFTPTSGRVGTRVNLSGLSLSSVTAVRFGNTQSNSFFSVTSVGIIVEVPRYSKTGPITVVTQGGSRVTTSSFRVIP